MKLIKVNAERNARTESGQILYDPIYINPDRIKFLAPDLDSGGTSITFSQGLGIKVQEDISEIIKLIGGN